MSQKEIKNLPEGKEQGELNKAELDKVSGGLAGSPVIGGIAPPSAKVNRTEIVFTGDEVDSQ